VRFDLESLFLFSILKMLFRTFASILFYNIKYTVLTMIITILIK